MGQDSYDEKRRAPRVDNSISLKISAERGDFVSETRNISSSGVYCRVDQYLEPMTRLKILLLLPQRRNGRVTTRKVSCGGVIVRTENIIDGEGFNIAVFFNDISSRDSKTLADFVEKALAQKNSSQAQQ